MDKSSMNPDLRTIVEWIEGYVGGEWKMTARQRQVAAQPLPNNVTIEAVIDAMPEQIEYLKERCAQTIPGWEPHEVNARSVARLITLTSASGRGIVGSLKDMHFQMMDRYDIFQEGVEEGWAQAQEEMVRDLYQDALMREPDKKGLRDHLEELEDGRSFFEKAIDFFYSPERQRLLNAQA